MELLFHIEMTPINVENKIDISAIVLGDLYQLLSRFIIFLLCLFLVDIIRVSDRQ